MITVQLSGTALTVRGHAGFSRYGSDIVCAAASMLAFTLAAAMAYDLFAMVPPIYKKPPGPKDTGGQTGNLLYKYYTTHWQNVNDTMLIWCGSHRAVQIFQFHFINLLFQKQFKPITALQRNKDIDIYYQHPCSNYYTISGSL